MRKNGVLGNVIGNRVSLQKMSGFYAAEMLALPANDLDLTASAVLGMKDAEGVALNRQNLGCVAIHNYGAAVVVIEYTLRGDTNNTKMQVRIPTGETRRVAIGWGIGSIIGISGQITLAGTVQLLYEDLRVLQDAGEENQAKATG